MTCDSMNRTYLHVCGSWRYKDTADGEMVFSEQTKRTYEKYSLIRYFIDRTHDLVGWKLLKLGCNLSI